MNPTNTPNIPVANNIPPPASIQTPSHVRLSHKFLLLYGVVLVVAALLGSVYAWQHSKVNLLNKKVKDLNSQVLTLQAKVDTLNSIKSDASNENSPLDYAGWKTFCDTTNSGCFRYPKAWTITGSSSSSKNTETITATNATGIIQYENPYTREGVDQVFYVASISNLNTKSLGFKIVGRVLGNTPDYVIVDDSYVTNNHVTADKTMSFMDNASFTDKSKKSSTHFIAKPSDAAKASIKTTDQAIAWFKTDDAKTSLKLLQSFYYQ